MSDAKDVRPFIDTNIVLYLLSDDPEKANRAEAVIAGGGVVSVQVLNEFVSVARNKLKLSWRAIREILNGVRANVDVAPLSIDTHELAVHIAERTRFTIYDASIVAAASLAGCTRLLSEDMQHGQKVDGVSILNPFLSR